MDWKEGLIGGLGVAVLILLVFAFWTVSSSSEYKIRYDDANKEKEKLDKNYQELYQSNSKLSIDYNDLLKKNKEIETKYKELQQTPSLRLLKDITSSPPFSGLEFLLSKESLIIKYLDLELSVVADTKSMHPVISSGYTIISTKKFNKNTLQVGNIVTYNATWSNIPVTHRILEVRTDDEGLCYILQGDNTEEADPGCVKPSQIRSLVVGIVYNSNALGFSACGEDDLGVAINNQLGCIPKTIKSGIYTSDQQLDSAIGYGLCSEVQPSKPYTVITPDGQIYCYSNLP